MEIISIQNLKNNELVADQCTVANHFWIRLKGLIGRSTLKRGEGLWIPRCGSIHMWFMRTPIDVVFLRPAMCPALRSWTVKEGSRWVVTSVHRNVKPWRLLPLWDFSATGVLELPCSTVQNSTIQAGDELCLS